MTGPLLAGVRVAGWASVGLLAILSLLPAQEMVRTSLGGQVEHALAYAGTAILMRLGYHGVKSSRHISMLVAYAGILEYLQHFSPGRTPAIVDWLSSSIGALAGSLIGGWIWSQLHTRVDT